MSKNMKRLVMKNWKILLQKIFQKENMEIKNIISQPGNANIYKQKKRLPNK